MRISDWSSDVCSSDLRAARRATRSGWRRRDGNWRARCGGRWPRVRTDGLGAGRGRAASQEGLGQAVRPAVLDRRFRARSEEHTSELQSLMRISYAVFCLKKKIKNKKHRIRCKNRYNITDQ